MKSRKENNIFDEKLASLFEDYEVTDITPNWNKMSQLVADTEMDNSISDKLSLHTENLSSEWDLMSMSLDQVYSFRRNIIIKQIFEISLALLLLLLIGQNFHHLLNQKSEINKIDHLNKKDQPSTQKQLIITDSPNDQNTSIAENIDIISTSEKAVQNSSSVVSSLDKSNIFTKTHSIADTKKSKSIGADDVKNPYHSSDNIITNPSIEENIISGNFLSNNNPSLAINQRDTYDSSESDYIEGDKTLSGSMALLKLARLKIKDLPFDQFPINLNANQPKIHVKTPNKSNKQYFGVATVLGRDFNQISYPKDTFFREKEIRYIWNDTAIYSSNFSYGLSLIIPKKNWLLEAEFSVSSKRSNINKSYIFGGRIEEFATWTLKSEKFDIYSLGINLNPIVFRTTRLKTHAILGTQLNIIHRYTPDDILEPIKDGLFPPDYHPLPIFPDEKSGDALYTENNSESSQTYSYVVLKIGAGMVVDIDDHVSFMLRSSYNYNYLNRYIGKTTARINAFNVKTGFIFYF